MQARCILILALALGTALALCLPAQAAGTTRTLKITQFYVYPGGDGGMNKLEGLAWPEVETLNALVRVEVGGVPDGTKVSVFLVVFDPDDDDRVVSKHKSQHYLPSGTHDLVFPDFMRTGDVFGQRGFDAKVEVSLDGVQPVQQATSFVITGPDPPDVSLVDLLLYNPAGGKTDQQFEPGDQFTLEATVEIEGNEGGTQPNLAVMAVMEEDMYLTDPRETQSQQAHWDTRTMAAGDGVYQLTASGYLPLFFASPWDFRHPFRLYVIVDFGPGLEQSDYVLGELMDYHNGDSRRNDNLTDRLIELDRAYKWTWNRLRGGAPDTRRFWDK
jgi:hypothetical protein